jgi:hypothetical protein
MRFVHCTYLWNAFGFTDRSFWRYFLIARRRGPRSLFRRARQTKREVSQRAEVGHKLDCRHLKQVTDNNSTTMAVRPLNPRIHRHRDTNPKYPAGSSNSHRLHIRDVHHRSHQPLLATSAEIRYTPMHHPSSAQAHIPHSPIITLIFP